MVGGRLRKGGKHCRSRGGPFDYLSKGGNVAQYVPMWCSRHEEDYKERFILIEAGT